MRPALTQSEAADNNTESAIKAARALVWLGVSVLVIAAGVAAWVML